MTRTTTCVVCTSSQREFVDREILAGTKDHRIVAKLDLEPIAPIDVTRHRAPNAGVSHVRAPGSQPPAPAPTPARDDIVTARPIQPNRAPAELAELRERARLMNAAVLEVQRERASRLAAPWPQRRRDMLAASVTGQSVLADEDRRDPEAHWRQRFGPAGAARRTELLSKSPAGGALLREEARRGVRHTHPRSGR